MNEILITVVLLSHLFIESIGQQCTSPSYQRCLCITTTPYCTCSALTSTNTLNFSSSYNSHLIAVASQGCRPCSSSCLRCSSLTTCTQCLTSFELNSGQCVPCPVNCQACSNGVCSTCIGGYYLDYQTNCQSCPIIGTAICTISSLQSCLSNYWLDNNAANCIQCDLNCLQCSSTTKCTVCNQGYYLLSNYTCAICQSQCLACSDALSCSLCANQSLYFNNSLGICTTGLASNCLIYSSSAKCSQCLPGFYLNSSNLCIQIDSSQLIAQCQIYGNNNGTITCKNCSVGYFNLSSGCFYGCSILCTSCSGPHYGLCYGCISTAYLLNQHCIPTFNLIQGASYQLFYTAYNNPTFFSGILTASSGCLLQTISGSSSGQVSFTLANLQSYEITLQWKIYLYKLTNNIQSQVYQVFFNNSQSSTVYSFNATQCISNCNGSSACIHKGSVDIAGIIINSNQVTFVVNASIGISEVLIIVNRCGGIQGSACLECSSTSTCTKCVNSNYYISGYTCVMSCPASYYVRTATKTCLSQCVAGTYANNIELLCLECQSPCLTCTSNQTCLTCVSDTYLYSKSCLTSCPDGYFPNSMRRTCDVCIRPCKSCISNIQCLSCIYGFYENVTHSCVLKCASGYYGNLQTINCERCLEPCLTCNSNIGTKCLTCINGTFLYSFSCLTTCPLGYFQQASECALCDSSCGSCSITAFNCTSCPLELYSFNYTCVVSCPEFYYADSTLNRCAACPKYCSSCVNSQYCQSCISGYMFYASSYSCLATCPQFYYPSAGICYSCQTPCFQCISQTQCLSCQGLFLYNYTCHSTCPSQTFGDTVSMSCLQCNISRCKECFSSANYCTSCNSSLILFNNNCLTNCPNGYYIQTTNNICLSCKDNCQVCLNLTYCVTCQDKYIFQNGNCIKVCDIGYYKISVNGSSHCQNCPISCTSCQTSNNIILCINCAAGYYNLNSTCLNTCGVKYFGYSGQCYLCIAPCSSCISENECLSCLPTMGYLFNNSCLNSCPLGYYQNTTSYQCSKCASSCLNCKGNASNCSSCSKGLVLQQNTCISTCNVGYFSISSTNTCYKCSSKCSSCFATPTNCLSCADSTSILISGSCRKSCTSGSYKAHGTCVQCPIGCATCINLTYCTQCSSNHSLAANYTCVNTCTSNYFALNGQCHHCSYPCKTCLNDKICLTCQTGYISSGNCVSVCSAPTYLNSVTLSCDACPSNCSSCLSPKECLECLQGVLVNGSCLSQCPQGYYDYYSVCAPCMYGCLSCTDSSTCTYCYIGYLYNGVCLQFCPVGWVNNPNTSYPICEQCISGCLKCTVQANQCTLCGNGLFLYLYTCKTVCPPGTYKNYKSNVCDTCKSPCETCQNGFSCTTCIYGYLLYAEQSGNQCIEGPSCPNSFYLNIINNICVYQCPNGTYVDPYGYTCNKPCSATYVLYKQNLTCLEFCPSGMWINSNFVCEWGDPPIVLPTFSCQGLILRNILIIDCTFNLPIQNLGTLSINEIQITQTVPVEIIMIDTQNIRIVTNTPVNVFRQTFFTVTFSNRYQLYADVNTQPTTSLQDNQRRLSSGYNMPVQNTASQFYLMEYFSYSDQQRDTGMQLLQIAQSICIGAFIFWFFAVLKNLKSTSLTFVCILQWIYSLSLIDTTFAPNLGLFLQGFKISNLFFIYSPVSAQHLWKIGSLYRETLWGIVNLFDFQTVCLPSLVIISFFGLVYLFTCAIQKKYSKNPQSSQNQSENKEIREGKSVHAVQFQAEKESELKKENQDEYEKQEKSIFSDKISSLHASKSGKIINANDSVNSQIQKSNQKSQKRSKGLSRMSQSRFIQKKSQSLKVDNSRVAQNEKKEEQGWEVTKYKLGLKCKIIHDRFYYNYWLQCTLLTASPLSIAVCCQIISATPLNLIASIVFAILSIVLIVLFLRKSLAEEKLFVTTKYWFILYLETLIQNGMAVLSTAQIYIGTMILMLTINIYVWNRIFSSKRSNQLKHFYQINDAIRMVLLLQALIGYTNKKNWSSDTYYYYSWIFIVTLIILIVFGAIHNTKQFFDREEGVRKSETKLKESNNSHQSQSESSIIKSRLTESKEVEDEQEIEEINQIEFFSQHEGEDTDSDNDIIDFDEANSIGEHRAPKELIRYQKPKHN